VAYRNNIFFFISNFRRVVNVVFFFSVVLRSSTATGNRERKRNPSYSLRCLLLSAAIWLKHELRNRPRDVNLRFRASLHSQLFGWSFGRLVGWSVGLLVGWSVGWLVGWSVGRLVGWSVGRLVGWSVGRLVGWSVGRSVRVILPAYTGYKDRTRRFETSANKIYSPGNYQR
jgi:hypothetical protein